MVAHTEHRAKRPQQGETCENKKGILSSLDEMPFISVLLLIKAW
jgi:hypothetical protein